MLLIVLLCGFAVFTCLFVFCCCAGGLVVWCFCCAWICVGVCVCFCRVRVFVALVFLINGLQLVNNKYGVRHLNLHGNSDRDAFLTDPNHAEVHGSHASSSGVRPSQGYGCLGQTTGSTAPKRQLSRCRA